MLVLVVKVMDLIKLHVSRPRKAVNYHTNTHTHTYMQRLTRIFNAVVNLRIEE